MVPENGKVSLRLSLKEELECLVGKRVRFQIREGRDLREIIGILVAFNSNNFKVRLNEKEKFSIIIPRKIVYNMINNECLAGTA